MSEATAKSIKTDLFTASTYVWTPCELKTFRVKGKRADLNDFGCTKDVKRDEAELFTCKCMKFFGDRTPRAGVLAKYGITRAEWTEIKNGLKEILFVGECGCCA